MVAVQNVGRAIFPLDEELGLQPGRYTPRLQEAMTRLGSKLPFQQAADEIKAFWKTEISEPTVRRTTHENGRACEAVARQAVEAIETQKPDSPDQGERLVISADGAFIGLTNGEWREVKTVAVGEFSAQWDAKKSELEVKSSKLSYFSRSYPAREFEHFALGELHRRGLEEAKEVVAVNDGAAWIQSFIDYHCPKAVRVIDFAHAQSYVGLSWAKRFWVKRRRLSSPGTGRSPTNSSTNRPIVYCQNWPGLANKRRLLSKKRPSSAG